MERRRSRRLRGIKPNQFADPFPAMPLWIPEVYLTTTVFACGCLVDSLRVAALSVAAKPTVFVPFLDAFPVMRK